MSNIVHTMYLRPIMVSESYHLVISSCVAYMPIMMGGVSVYSAVYSYLAMQGPGSETTGLSKVTLDTAEPPPPQQYYG